MTVKDIFELRKQGKIEEAYEAIKPMYAVHKGHYTTLCMFWTARDIFNKRMAEGRIEEATKIYKALQRVLPNIGDTEGNATAFMQYAARALASIVPTASPAATAPAGSPAVPPAATAPSGSPTATVSAAFAAVPPTAPVPASSVLAGSASSFSSLHFSGEFAPAQTGSPACPVPSDSIAENNALTGSPGEALAATVPAASPAVPASATGPASSVLAGSPGEIIVPPAATAPAASPAAPPTATVPAAFAAVPPAAPPASHLGSAILLLPWGQKKVLDCIKTYPGISVPRLSKATRIPAKSIERHISALIDKKLIEHRGSKKTGGYYPL